MDSLTIAELENNGGAVKGFKGFQPGKSGNPGGRPKGLAQLVRELTNNGKELVILHLEIMRGKLAVDFVNPEGFKYKRKPSIRDRMEAAQWLADRGFGKTEQTNINQTIIMGGDVDLVKNIRDAAMEIAGLTESHSVETPALPALDIQSDCSSLKTIAATSGDTDPQTRLTD